MIDKSKTYRTRDGREVRIYATDGGGIYPIHGAVRCDDEWTTESWAVDGKWDRLNRSAGDNNDLIEVKPRIKREVWVNVYRNGVEAYSTRHSADYNTEPSRIACVKLTIDVEEGEGL